MMGEQDEWRGTGSGRRSEDRVWISRRSGTKTDKWTERESLRF